MGWVGDEWHQESSDMLVAMVGANLCESRENWKSVMMAPVYGVRLAKRAASALIKATKARLYCMFEIAPFELRLHIRC